MDVTVTVEDGVAIITMDGHLDALSAPQAKDAFREYGNGDYHAVVDLAKVSFIDSSGLASLISGLKTFRSQGKEFRLAAVQPNVRQVLTLTMLDRAFDIRPDVRTAVNSVGA
ncbi:MAG: STAS domain-containing protein [Thermomicrobiales bacterium]